MNNDVFKVLFLPTDGNLVTTGLVSGLANGQWGVFNYETGVAVDPSSASNIPANFFIAYVGDGTLGNAGELYTTTGSHVETARIKSATKQSYAAAVSQTITLSAFQAQSGANATNYDYGLKLDFRGNSEVYQRFGANQASKFFEASTRTVGSAGAAADAGAEVLAQWAAAIAGDPDQFIDFVISGTGIGGSYGSDTITGPISYTSSGTPGLDGTFSALNIVTAGNFVIGDTYTIVSAGSTDFTLIGAADSNVGTTFTATGVGTGTGTASISENIDLTSALAAIRAYTTGSNDLQIVFTINPVSAMYKFCNVNAKYFKLRQIKAIPSLIGDETNWATVAETAMVYEQGVGYDIQELEYLAGGFTGKPGPYRQSNLHGLPFSNFEYLATKTAHYDVYVLEYDQSAIGGWEKYLNQESTYFPLVSGGSYTEAIGALTSIINAAGQNLITS